MALLFVPSPASADWLQAGHDAGRSSATPENGPTWNDEAFTIQLPGGGPSDWRQPDPILVGSKAYVAGETVARRAVVYEVDLMGGTWREFASPVVEDALGTPLDDAFITAMASDGAHLYVLLQHGGLQSLALDDGRPRWKWSMANAARLPLTGVGQCTNGVLALAGGDLFAACDDFAQTARGVQGSLFAWRMNTTDGSVHWSITWNGPGADQPPEVSTNPPGVNGLALFERSGEIYLPTGITVLGDTVILAVRKDYIPPYLAKGQDPVIDEADTDPLAQSLYLGIGADDGASRWYRPGPVLPYSSPPQLWAPPAVGTSAAAYLELDVVRLVDLGTAAGDDRRAAIRGGLSPGGDPGSGMALAPEGLYATSSRGVHLLDSTLGHLKSWELEQGLAWGRGSPVRTSNGLLIARFGPDPQGQFSFLGDFGGIQALEARTLRPVWAHPGAVNCTFAVSDGVIVRWCEDGQFQVLGRNAASIQPLVQLSSVFPRPGDAVRVDMGGTGSGVFGPATEFRAVWGDGSETEWQESPVFEHRYTVPLDAHARFYARNANQTASHPVLFHVGGDDPSVNILNSPFADKYQETSFFFLGLLLTALAAAFGVYRAGRKRRRFRRELRELEGAYKQLHDDARACDTMLNERKARARALFLEKRLEETHASFLERRVDELRRGLRLGTLEDKLSFLPYGMVVHLQRFLADSRVDEWERVHFIDALTKQKELSAEQQTLARKVIDEWFARDAKVRA